MTTPAIREEMQRLADENDGRLTPDIVLNAASDPASPMHDRFTWSDREAAHKQRLDEARKLIAESRIRVTAQHFDLVVPAFVRDPTVPAHEQGYIALARLRTDHELARDAIVGEFQRAAALLSRARALALVLGLADEVDSLKAGIEALALRAAQQEAGTDASVF